MSQDLLEILFDRTPMGIAVLDPDWRLDRCNPAWVDFIDRCTPSFASQVTPGVSLFDLAPDTKAILGPVFERSLRGETVQIDAFRAESGGVISYWDMVFHPLIENEQIVGIVGTTTEVTERVLAYQELEQRVEALQEKQERWNLVLQATNDGIWDWNLETNQVYFSPRWKAMLGYRKDKIENHLESWRGRIHPDDLEKTMAAIQAHLKGQTPAFRLEHRLRHKDGSYRWILARGRSIRDANGKPHRMVGTHTDITERRRSQKVLEESEANFRSLFKNAVDFAVYRVAIDSANPYGGRVIMVSPSVKDIMGVPDPYRFESWFENVHPGDLPRVQEANQRAWLGGERYDQVARFYNTAKQQWVWVHTISTPILDDQGKVKYFNGLVVDITEQKQTEKALHHLAAFENVITTISTNFIKLAADQVDSGINRALETIGEFAQVDRSYVFLFSGDKTRMNCTHEWCAEGVEPQIERMKDVPLSHLAWSNARLLEGQVLHIPRVADLTPEASAERKEFQTQGILSLIAVPMVYRGVVIGFLGFDSVHEEKVWPQEDIRLLKMVGEIFVNALEHKRAQAIQAGQRQFLELLATGGTLSETLHSLVHIIEEQWPGMLGLVLLLDEEGRHLHYGAAVSLPEEYTHSIEGLEIGPMVGSCGTASYLGQRVIVEDIATDPRWDGLRDLAVKYGLKACWSEPVFSSNGRVIGTFAMYYRHPRAPTGAELRTIEIAAHLVGIAVEQRRAQEELEEAYQTLEQRVRERTHELSTLLEISHNVASTLELEPLMGRVLDQLRAVVNYNGASIMMLDGDILNIVAYRGPLSQQEALQIRFSLDEALANREVIRRQAPVLVGDARGNAPLARALQEAAGESWETIYGYIRSWMGVPLIVKNQVVGMLTLDHSEFDFFTSQHAELTQTFANQVAVAVENARLYQAEQERLEESERRRQVAEGLRDILNILNSDRPLGEILDHIVTRAGRLSGANAGVIYHIEINKQLIAVEAACGMPAEFMALKTMPLTDTEPNQAILDRQPFAVTDLTDRLTTVYPDSTSFPAQLQTWSTVVREHFGAYLAVPLVVKDKVYGAISLYYHTPREFSDEEIELAIAFADQAALAIENARLRAQAQQAAVTAERSRLARDLHDAVTQTLFSASLIAEVLPRLWERNSDEGHRRLEELRELTRGALAEMRTLLLELRPSALVEAKLSDLLRQLAESIIGRARVPVVVEVKDEFGLPAEVKVALYRIAQEALNNVAKHAGASQATVRLQRVPSARGTGAKETIELSIHDDGRGFEPESISPDSLGLGIMRERAETIGAALQIESQLGKGSQVTVIWQANETRRLT